jgi:hypothetical protein
MVSGIAFSVEYAFQGELAQWLTIGREEAGKLTHSTLTPFGVESYTLILLIFCVGDDIEEMIDAAVDRFYYVTYLVSC